MLECCMWAKVLVTPILNTCSRTLCCYDYVISFVMCHLCSNLNLNRVPHESSMHVMCFVFFLSLSMFIGIMVLKVALDLRVEKL